MENKTSKPAFAAGKYLKYAVGEVLLVMIGILLAVQVNIWNTKRIEKQKEKILLAALNTEFKSNRLQLDTVIFNHKKDRKSNEYLLSRLPIKDVKKENLDSLAYHLWNHTDAWTFNPSNGVTSSIMNSSDINIISNNELRQLLVGWNDLLFDYQEEEILAQYNYYNLLKPYEKKHFLYGGKNMLTDSRIDLSFLTRLEFDNYVLDRKNNIKNILENNSRELEAIINAIDKIIELSEPSNYD
jgi:uncharacterized protein DUF6090